MSLKVFISYAKEDRDRALEFYDLLAQEGFSPWMDEKQILPGQNWEAEIDKAFKDANVIVLLLSRNSVSKRGFVRREANDAFDRLRYRQPTDIYIIPLLLESCDVPSYISERVQYVDLDTEGAWGQIRASLNLASEQQSIELSQGSIAGPFRVFTERVEEKWEGAPGHDIRIEYPRFESASRSALAQELTLFFGGRATTSLVESRHKPWDQSPEFFQDTRQATAMDGRWENFDIVNATDELLSLIYDVSWYGAGAMHAHSLFATYNFSLREHLCRLELKDFFSNITAAISCISERCVDELCREYWHRLGKRPDELQRSVIQGGAGENYENFTEFAVSADHFTFLFSQYTLGPGALGSWSVDVSFYDLDKVLRPDGPHNWAASTL